MNNEREQKHACMENKLSIALGNLKNIEKYLKDHDKQMKLNYPDGQPEPSYEIVLLENAKKSLKQFLELENAIESGELVQVVHGKWELVQKFKKPDVKKCSNCGYEEMILITDENKKRCPNCGAKMDGKDDE